MGWADLTRGKLRAWRRDYTSAGEAKLAEAPLIPGLEALLP
jgi:hypothetical protein